ncbi:hypothetical protein DICA0_B06326 [Diutina catenulata]
MAYLNQHFVTVDDLGDIDARLGELNDRAGDIELVAEQKSAQGTDSHRGSVVSMASQRSTKYTAAVEEVMAEVRAVPHMKPEIALEHLQRLHDQYGTIEILLGLKQIVIQRQRVEAARDYLKQLSAIEAQLDDVVANADSLTRALAEVRDGAEHAPVKEGLPLLEKSVEAAIDAAKTELQKQLAGLVPSEWPCEIAPDRFKKIKELMGKLNSIQLIQGAPEYPKTWWSVDVLVAPVVAQFHYHFSQGKATDQLTKPEWALEWVDQWLSSHLESVNHVFADTFTDRFFACEVISSLLTDVRLKMAAAVTKINRLLAQGPPERQEKTGRLLSHLIFELSAFDQRLRAHYSYNPYARVDSEAPRRWSGVVGDILWGEDDETVQNWLRFEHQLAHDRFSSDILALSDAWSIDFEYQHQVKEPQLKPTYSAHHMVRLLKTLTSHFYSLSAVKYQLKFVANVEMALLDEYHDAVSAQLQKFSKLWSQGVLGFLPGGATRDRLLQVAAASAQVAKSATQRGRGGAGVAPQVSASDKRDLEANSLENGLKALEMATGAYCSAAFIRQSLVSATDDLVFIQLWDYYSTHIDDTTEDTTIFDPQIAKFEQLATRAFNVYRDFFTKEVKERLKTYINQTRWDIGQPEEGPHTELAPFATAMIAYIEWVHQCLPEGSRLLFSDQVLSVVASVFTDYVVNNNGFTDAGIEQLNTDIEYVFGRLGSVLYLTEGSVSNKDNKAYRRMRTSLAVLGLGEAGAREYISGRPLSDLRSQFDDGLEALTSHQIMGLLPRLM